MQTRKPLHEAMRDGSLSLGAFGAPGELLGAYVEAGFNHLIIDQMFGVMTGAEASGAISRTRAAGLAPIVRVHTYPWSGEESGDMGVATEVASARMQGAAGAVVSYSTVAQLKACIHAAEDTEHSPIANRNKMVKVWKDGGGQSGGWDAVRNSLPRDLRDFTVVAYMEDVALMKDIEEVIELPGLRAVGFGIHDITITSGHPFEVDHPDVWAIIDRVVALAKPRGISVWTNTGYIYTRLEETVDRINRMYGHGVDVIQLQGGAHFFAPVISDISQQAFAAVPDRSPFSPPA